MRDLYWITVLGNIHVVMTFLLALTILLFLIFTVMYCCAEEEEEERKIKNVAITSLVGFLISGTGLVFIPSKEQLYTIYGIGSTIDYMKDNPEVKKMPDNVIKAANAFFEQYQQEKKEDKTKEYGTGQD